VRTAIDTNVISAIWSGEREGPQLLEELNKARLSGGLVVCPIVFAELHGYPHMTRFRIEDFLSITGIVVDWNLDRDVWSLASSRYQDYANRRRKNRHGEPKRFLADFLVGAHATLYADQLITRDKRRYSIDFSDLNLV
jgi:predicted nucleic acid-binding protein